MESYNLAFGLAGLLLFGIAGLELFFCLIFVFVMCIGEFVFMGIAAWEYFLQNRRARSFDATPSQSRIDEVCDFVSRQYKQQTAAPRADSEQTIVLPGSFNDVSAGACRDGLMARQLWCYERVPTLFGKRRFSVRPLSSVRRPI